VPIEEEAELVPQPVWTLSEREQFLNLGGNRNSIPLSSFPYPSHYTHWAILALFSKIKISLFWNITSLSDERCARILPSCVCFKKVDNTRITTLRRVLVTTVIIVRNVELNAIVRNFQMLTAAQKLLLWKIYVAGNTALTSHEKCRMFLSILTKSLVFRRM